MTHDEIIDKCLGHAAGLFDRLRLTRMCRMAVADSNEVALTNNVRLVTALRAQVKQRDEQIVKLLQMVSSQPSQASPRFDLVRAIVTGLGRSNCTHGKPSDIVKLADSILAAMKTEVSQ